MNPIKIFTKLCCRKAQRILSNGFRFSLTLSSAFGGYGRILSNSFATTCSLSTRSPHSAIGGRRQTLYIFVYSVFFFFSSSPLLSLPSSHCVCYTQPKNRHVQRVHCTKIRLILIVCMQHDAEFTYPISFRLFVSWQGTHRGRAERRNGMNRNWSHCLIEHTRATTNSKSPFEFIPYELARCTDDGDAFFLIAAVQAQRNRFAIMSYFLFRMEPVSHFSFLHLHKRCRKHPREEEEKINTKNAK